MAPDTLTRGLMSFLDASPTPFHAVSNLTALLDEAGYAPYTPGAPLPGGKYYLKRNGSALIAWQLPQAAPRGLRFVAAHTDSPCFKVKESPEMDVEGRYVKLNTEPYGGMLRQPWLDRPLSVAGRVLADDGGAVTERLVDLERDLLIIPSVAIHMDREANKGRELNPQVDLLPLMGCEKGLTLRKLCAQALSVDEDAILGSDLFVYNRDRARIMGADGSLIGAPRLDDLQCAYAGLMGFLAAQPQNYGAVYAAFDNEEIGSGTKQGADSTFLRDVVELICAGLGLDEGSRLPFLERSFLLSADNAHAVHPNHPEKCDPTNRPYLNGGVVLKFHGGQKYTTDGQSAAVITRLCRRNDIPLQTFANRSDLQGGSTLGNISTAHVSVPSADVGLPQLAMHSPFETAGVRDTDSLVRLTAALMSE